MYSTSSTATRVPWAAHPYNVAFSDEIGHFEYCNGVNPTTLGCNNAGVNDPSGRDGDDVFCFSPAQSTSVKVGGCLGSDADFDGVPYQNTWPGTFSNASQDALVHPFPIRFTSPLFNGTHNYAQAAFETDLPRIEFATSPPHPVSLLLSTQPAKTTGLSAPDCPVNGDVAVAPYPIRRRLGAVYIQGCEGRTDPRHGVSAGA